MITYSIVNKFKINCFIVIINIIWNTKMIHKKLDNPNNLSKDKLNFPDSLSKIDQENDLALRQAAVTIAMLR